MTARVRVGIAMLGVVVVAGLMTAQTARKPDAPKKEPEISGRLTPATAKLERAAINKRIDAFSTAYNKGDLDGLMALWSDDAEFVSETGKQYRGKEAIRVLLKRSLGANKGAKQTVNVLAVRFLKPDIALETGEVTVTAEDGSATTGKYEAVWIKLDDVWYLNRIRDIVENGEAGDTPLATSQLKPLAWIVGEWTDKEGKGDVSLTCKWGADMTYLVLTFVVKREAGKNLVINQRIGYDAANGTLRSWVFDSAGGFGGGYWTREGNAWSVASGGTYPDGRGASSADEWKYVNDGEFVWSSRNREVEEVPAPDITITFVKKAAR